MSQRIHNCLSECTVLHVRPSPLVCDRNTWALIILWNILRSSKKRGGCNRTTHQESIHHLPHPSQSKALESYQWGDCEYWESAQSNNGLDRSVQRGNLTNQYIHIGPAQIVSFFNVYRVTSIYLFKQNIPWNHYRKECSMEKIREDPVSKGWNRQSSTFFNDVPRSISSIFPKSSKDCWHPSMSEFLHHLNLSYRIKCLSHDFWGFKLSTLWHKGRQF